MAIGVRMEQDVRVLCAAGLRAGGLAGEAARRVLQKLTAPAKVKAPKPSGEQGVLWHPETGTPWRLSPDAKVPCPPFDAQEIPVSCCLARQGATWPGRNKLKDGSVRDKRAAIHAKCAGCSLGKIYRQAVRGYAPPKYKTYRSDSHEQHVARRKHLLSTPNWQPPNEERGPSSPVPELEEEDVREILERGKAQ